MNIRNKTNLYLTKRNVRNVNTHDLISHDHIRAQMLDAPWMLNLVIIALCCVHGTTAKHYFARAT